MSQQSKAKNRNIILIILGVGFIFGTFYGWIQWDKHTDLMISKKGGIPSAEMGLPELGQVGDSYGGVNSLLSFLTVLGLAFSFIVQFALYMNSQESKVEEDKDKHLDAFEKGFYRLLDLFIETREVIEGVKVPSPIATRDQPQNEDVFGRNAIITGLENLARKINIRYAQNENKEAELKDYLSDWHRDAKIKNPLAVRQLFLLLRALVKSLFDLKLNYPESEEKFVEVLKAILSEDELYFLCLWIVSNSDAPFRSYLARLHLLPDFDNINTTIGRDMQNRIKTVITTNQSLI